jgi:hypothetical protein
MNVEYHTPTSQFPSVFSEFHPTIHYEPSTPILPLGFRRIPLSMGQVALVDTFDYDRLSAHKWYADRRKNGYFYACRHEYLGTFNGKPKARKIYLHREVKGLRHGDPRRADHVRTGETLDCRRDNLRPASVSQNGHNRPAPCNNSSGFKGVSRSGPNRWRATIEFQGRQRHLGTRSTPEAAAALHVAEAQRLAGEFAYRADREVSHATA